MPESQESLNPRKFISITKLTLHNPKDIAIRQKFIEHISRSFEQSRDREQVKGLLRPALIERAGDGVYYTLTVWESEDNMNNFKETGAHKEAMQQASQIGYTDAFHYYAEEVPTIDKAIVILNEEIERKNRNNTSSQS